MESDWTGLNLSPVNPQTSEGSFLLGSHVGPTQVLSSSRQNPQYPGYGNTHRPSNLCFKKSNNAFCIISVTCNWASNTLRYNKNITNYDKTTLLLLRMFENLGFPLGKCSMWGHHIFLFWVLIQWQWKSQRSELIPIFWWQYITSQVASVTLHLILFSPAE